MYGHHLKPESEGKRGLGVYADGMHVWQQPYEQLRMPMVGNLRTAPFERAYKESIGYGKWGSLNICLSLPLRDIM